MSPGALHPAGFVQAPPPATLKHDQITPEDLTRLPPFKPHRFGFLRGKHLQRNLDQKKDRKSSSSSDIQEDERLSDDIEVSDVPFVRLDSGVLYREGLEEEYVKDVYRWAVIYENQRG